MWEHNAAQRRENRMDMTKETQEKHSAHVMHDGESKQCDTAQKGAIIHICLYIYTYM